MGRMIRFWPLILSALALATAYGALSYSVKDHIRVDDDRIKLIQSEMRQDRSDIDTLKANIADLKEGQNEGKQLLREILRRVR